MWVSTQEHRYPQNPEASDLLQLELWKVVNHLTQVLGVNLRSSSRIVCTLLTTEPSRPPNTFRIKILNLNFFNQMPPLPLMMVALTGMDEEKWRQGLFIGFWGTQHMKSCIVNFKNSVPTIDENVHSKERLAAALAILYKGLRLRSEENVYVVLNLWAMTRWERWSNDPFT